MTRFSVACLQIFSLGVFGRNKKWTLCDAFHCVACLQIFSLDVYGRNRKPLSTDQLYKQLQVVADQSQYPASPLGLLTTLDRDTWGAVYADLVKGELMMLATSGEDGGGGREGVLTTLDGDSWGVGGGEWGC